MNQKRTSRHRRLAVATDKCCVASHLSFKDCQGSTCGYPGLCPCNSERECHETGCPESRGDSNLLLLSAAEPTSSAMVWGHNSKGRQQLRIFRNVLSALGCIVLVALVTSLVAPRATHGLMAELIQVTNTASNPVPMQVADDPAKSPFSQYIYLPRAHTAAAFPEAPAGHRSIRTSSRTRQIEKPALPRTRSELHAYSAASRPKRQCNYASDPGDFQ
jgi:hypothetical protein